MSLNSAVSSLSIITEGALKPKLDGDQLYIAVKADSIEELTSPDAKRLAYNARHGFGFTNAGIEKYSGPSPIDDAGDVDTEVKKAGQQYGGYAVIFKLTLPAV